MVRTSLAGAVARGSLVAGVVGAMITMPTTAVAQMQTVDFGTAGIFNCSGVPLAQPIPSGDARFGGLTFTGFSLTQTGNAFSGTANCRATNGSSLGGVATTMSSISSDGLFVFNSTTFRRSINAADVSVMLTGMRGGSQVFQQIVTASSNDFVMFTPSFMGAIDRLEFAASGGSALTGPQFQIDDFAFTAANIAVVPEPASMLLVGTGLAGLLAGARRRRNKA